MAIYPDTNKTMLEKILSGDEISWQAFYQRYAPVVRTMRRISGLPEACEDDIVQDVMSRFAQKRSTYIYTPERARFRTYFNRIVRNTIADQFRKMEKQDRINSLCDVSESSSVSPEWEKAELDAWRNAVLEEAMDELSQRVSSKNFLAFTMSTSQGRSIRETADFLGLSTAQVHQARFRCGKILKEIIARCNNADPDLNLPNPEK